VTRVSGTDNAHRRWLQRFVEPSRWARRLARDG